MQEVLKFIAPVTFSLAAGIGGFFAFRKSAAKVRENLGEALSSTDATITAEVSARLERYGLRRNRWGAVGAGIGLTLGMLTVLIPERAIGDLMLAPALFLPGLGIGSALSSIPWALPAKHSPRVATLRSHGLRDYLHYRELVAEIVFAATGLAATLAGVFVLAEDRETSTGWGLVAAGLLIASASLAALILQRRLLARPLAAESEAQLVGNDLMLATGLRDLVNVSGSATAMTTCALLLWLPVSVWTAVLGMVLLVALINALLDTDFFRGRAPDVHAFAPARSLR